MNFTSFIGQAQTAIDGKGRTSFPREFRRQLSASEGNEFVVTRGPDRTLRLFVLPEFRNSWRTWMLGPTAVKPI